MSVILVIGTDCLISFGFNSLLHGSFERKKKQNNRSYKEQQQQHKNEMLYYIVL